MAKRKAARGTKKAAKKTARRTARKAARKTARTARPAARKAPPRKTARKAAKQAARAKTAARPARRATARKAAPKAARRVAPKKAAPKKAAPKKVVNTARNTARNAAAKELVARKAPALDRARRTIIDEEDMVPTPPSSLDLDRSASAVRTGRRGMSQRMHEHTETSPALTGGDVDADWESAYSVGDEAPGGDNPTPDQDIVDDIGKAVGVEYQDNEELKGEDKIIKRDRNRWELDPASSEDWDDRD
jgi:hypothetical protein